MSIRVRIAPSPTGFIHLGNLRTLLYDYFLAKKEHGTFVLRVEDTDQSRFVPGAKEAFCRSLKRLDIIPDEGQWIDDEGHMIDRGPFAPYLQSKRKDKHAEYAKQLLEKGLAYPCFCTESRLETMRKEQQDNGLPTGYDGHCRNIDPIEAKKMMDRGEMHVLRLKLPKEGVATFHDEIRGDISCNWKDVDDQVIIKSDGMATYHLAATCDDRDMEITHVLRGEEWVSSTPKHLFIYNAFGWTTPKFAHLPLLLNADRSKLSKRQGDVFLEDYLDKGYLPDAVINFVALQGWNPGGDQEIYSREELINGFNLSKVNKGGAVVNFEKLDWMNSHYIKQLDQDAWRAYAEPSISSVTKDAGMQERLLASIRDRVTNYATIVAIAKEFVEDVEPTAEIIRFKTQTSPEAIERLRTVKELFALRGEDLFTSIQTLEESIKKMITDHGWGNGDVLWPLRITLSGKKQSPPPFDYLFVLGKEESTKKIDRAIQLLENAL